MSFGFSISDHNAISMTPAYVFLASHWLQVVWIYAGAMWAIVAASAFRWFMASMIEIHTGGNRTTECQIRNAAGLPQSSTVFGVPLWGHHDSGISTLGFCADPHPASIFIDGYQFLQPEFYGFPHCFVGKV